jgi:hypothetical protein
MRHFLHPRSAIIYNTKNKLMGRYMNSQFCHHHMPQMADSRQPAARHPAAAMGTPMCGRDGPSACSAGDKRHQRGGRLQVSFGFGRKNALFLARYTPCFWLKYTPKRRFWKTRRLLRGVFFWASITWRIFLWIRAVHREKEGEETTRSNHQLRKRREKGSTSEEQNNDQDQRGGSTHRNKRDVHGRSPPRRGWPKAESATPSTLDNNQGDTGATQRTPEGTHTDEGKEGSAYARTKRPENRHNWRS